MGRNFAVLSLESLLAEAACRRLHCQLVQGEHRRHTVEEERHLEAHWGTEGVVVLVLEVDPKEKDC